MAQKLEMPEAEGNGFVKTLNNMGYMTSTLDPFSLEFVAFAPQAPGPSLEIGAAYGVATLPALAQGASVIANDLDARHLQILTDRVPEAHRSRFSTIAGSFPEEIRLEKGVLGATLVARVLHFFDGPKIELSMHQIAAWLAPGGKLFIVAETPYLKNFLKFQPIYEARKRAGAKWPGFVENVHEIAPDRAKFLPKTMHLLDADVLRRAAEDAGLIVEKVHTIPRPDFPEDIRFDGRESVGLVAVKPK